MARPPRVPWGPILALLVLVVAVVGVTWPGVLHLGSRTIGDGDFPGLRGEVFLQRLVVQEMAAGRPFAATSPAIVNFPHGESIRAHIGLSANLLFSLPVAALLPPIAAQGVVVLLLLLANGLAMIPLARDHVRGWALPSLAGLWMVADPYVLWKTTMGFPQKAMIFVVPLLFLFLLRAVREGRPRDGIGAGLALALLAAIYPPWGIYGAVAVGLYAAWDLVGRRRPLVTATWVALALLPLVAVSALTAAAIHGTTPGFTPTDLTVEGSLDPLHPLRGHPYSEKAPAVARGMVIGLPAVVLLLAVLGAVLRPTGEDRGSLADAGARRSTRLLLAATVVVFLVLALGPRLASEGQPLRIAGFTVALPHALLARLPYGHRLIFPLRCLPFALVPAMLLATLGTGDLLARLPRLGGGAPPLAAVALAVLAALQVRVWLPEILPVPVRPPPQAVLADTLRDTGRGPVLFWPPSLPTGEEYLYPFLGVLSDRPVVNPVNPGPGPSLLHSAPSCQDDTRPRDCAFLAALAYTGVQHVVFLPEMLAWTGGCVPGWRDLLGHPIRSVEGPGETHDLTAFLYTVPSAPPPACDGW